jgi:hypothetical protein
MNTGERRWHAAKAVDLKVLSDVYARCSRMRSKSRSSKMCSERNSMLFEEAEALMRLKQAPGFTDRFANPSSATKGSPSVC